MTKNILIEPVTRIEGHAKITIDIGDNDEIMHSHLQVLEIRGFEKFLEKMELFKMPLITARICGVCPAAHHLAAVTAIENGCSASLPEEVKSLRELLYAGHILHSHALSCFVLLGPDLISGIGSKPDERNIFHLLDANANLAKKALKLRTIGQRIVETVGGRGVHPVTAIPGGMAARPTDEEMKNMAQWGTEAVNILDETRPVITEALQKLDAIRSTSILESVPLALSKNGIVSFLEGDCRVTDRNGKVERSFPAGQYSNHLTEKVMPGSYMKSVYLRDKPEKDFFVGPLARLNVNDSFSTSKATELLKNFKTSANPRFSALDNIEARLIEMVHCADRIVEIASQPPACGKLRIELYPKEGRYIGLIEAPRGILIHDYSADAEGRITAANLIVATQNNYNAINASITSMARHFMPMKDEALFMNGVEFAVRCFDPCLSCATHALGTMRMKIEICKSGKIIRTITRKQS
jgi:F420-non-reducing hydrogenase large subunit